MAKKFGARKCDKYIVVSIAPSVNKTPVGSSIVPIPYPVSQELDTSKIIAKDVNFNSKKVFLKKSHTSKVVGDEPGTAKGVKSGTLSEKAEPKDYSPSVRANGIYVIREDDKYFMQGKNTIGKLTTKDAGSGIIVTDKGQIEGDTLPPDLDMDSLSSQISSVDIGAANSSNPISNGSSGALGSSTGSPVLLKTAQLKYTSQELELWGKLPLSLERTYLSRDKYTGIFGNHWRYMYEQEFKQIDENIYRLFLADGRKFDFEKQNDTFLDLGNLGVEIEALSSTCFKIKCFKGRVFSFVDEKLVLVEDLNKNFISINYNKKGKIQEILNSEGTSLEFYYNSKDFVTKVIDNTQRVWQFKYDLLDNLIQSKNPKNIPTNYKYTPYTEKDGDKSFLLTKILNHNNTTKLEVTYTNDAKVASYKEDEQSFSYKYLSNTMIKKQNDEGDTIFYGLDKNGQIEAISHSDGSTSKQTYDKTTRIATFIDQGGNETLKYFDDRNRVIKEIDQENKETLYKYEGENPLPIAIIEEKNKLQFTYDKKGNLLEINKNSVIQKFEYDEKGNLTKSIDAKGSETNIEYDKNSRPIKYTDAKGVNTLITYDLEKGTESITDIEGNTIINYYDILDNIVETKQENHIITYTYDQFDRLITICDPLQNTTQFSYDNYDRVIKQTLPNKKEKSFIYNKDNTLKTLVQEDNTKVEYTYNKAKKVVEIKTKDEILSYEYDSLGNIISANSNDSYLEYIYDSNANIINQTQDEIELDKAYDSNTNKLTNLILFGQNFSYQRDEQNTINAIQTPKGTINLSYDENKVLIARSYPNNKKEKIQYDQNYNITQIQTANDTLNYELNDIGQIVKKNDIEFSYDNYNRLIQTNTQEFSYDLAGNILGENTIYDTADYRLLSSDTYELYYDDRGNLKEKLNKHTKEKTLYTFNIKNQLIQYKKYNPNGGVIQELSFSYDALGRRVSKTHNNTTYYYVYDNLNIVAILDKNKQLLATIVHDEDIDKPLSITTYEHTHKYTKEYEELCFEQQYLLDIKHTKTYYYHRDHQGSIIALSDNEGNITESFIYDDSYGTILQHNKTAETYNPYCYTSREFDCDDLYYYRARYYDPKSQRFLSQDPIEFLSGDYNFYRYVDNNPIGYTDALGLAKCNQKKLEKKLNQAKGKVASKLKSLNKLKAMAAKKVAKKVATLPLKAVPLLGWAMAAYDVYDTVTTGIDIYDMVKEYDAAADAVEEAGKKLADCKKNAAKDKKDGAKVKEDKKNKKKKCKDPTGKKTEAKMHKHYISQGYEPVHTPKYHGIDGVYKHKVTGKIVVAEAKFGSSSLGRNTDGLKQMSQGWVEKNLGQVKDTAIKKSIKQGNYTPEVFRVKKDCSKNKKVVNQKGMTEASIPRGKGTLIP